MVISLFVAVVIGIVGASALPELVDRSALIGASDEALKQATSTSETIFIAIANVLGQKRRSAGLVAGVYLARYPAPP